MDPETRRDHLQSLLKLLSVIAFVYLFLLSINLMGEGFKLLGEGFVKDLLKTTSNPFAGLMIGVLVTSIIQSSSTTTSITVGLVAGGMLELQNAIPIIMGANIGTTITNTIVSLGHITRKDEFERALTASIVHDFFNVFAVMLFFPLEMKFHFIQYLSKWLENIFAHMGGAKLFNPLKFIVKPAVDNMVEILRDPVIIIVIALVILFFSLAYIVKIMRKLVFTKIEGFLNNYLFSSDFTSFGLGVVFTAFVQSSSVTTSLIVPLVGANFLTVRKIFPYTLGANIGTTITALLAALSTQNDVALRVAFAHLIFNIFGIVVFYPLRILPIKSAQVFAKLMVKSKKHMIALIAMYILLHVIPVIFIFFL